MVEESVGFVEAGCRERRPKGMLGRKMALSMKQYSFLSQENYISLLC
jgi:hypothetical protein